MATIVRPVSALVIAAIGCCVASALARTQVGQSPGIDTDRLEATRVCAEQGRMVGPRLVEWHKTEMVKAGVSVEPSKDSNIDWTFSAHFNGERKRCFIEVVTRISGKSGTFTFRDAYDAFEGQHIGKLATVRKPGETRDSVFIARLFGEDVDESVYRGLMRD